MNGRNRRAIREPAGFMSLGSWSQEAPEVGHTSQEAPRHVVVVVVMGDSEETSEVGLEPTTHSERPKW